MSGGRVEKQSQAIWRSRSGRTTNQARKLCRLGATNQDLADFFEVNIAPIQDWHPAP
jgi:hypothetical protein